MRGMHDEYIDLIYLDPPFNSDANYAAPIGSEAAGAEFKDTWGLSDIDLAWYGEIADRHPGLYELLTATRSIHGDSMMSYLIYLGIRMMEMRRVLKNDGSIYLHCDPTAAHYLKLLMDSIFGKKNFRNEVIWSYNRFSRRGNKFPSMHDNIYFYTKTDNYVFNKLKTQAKSSKRYQIGYHVVGGGDNKKLLVYDMEKVKNKGIDLSQYNEIKLTKARAPNLGSDWYDIPIINPVAKERTGYPTQKPVELLQRIIRASSNEGDMILDPFCGCATACIASEIEHRQWIGIDVSPKAYDLVKSRLKKEINVGATEKEGEHEPIFGYEVIHRTDIPGDRKGQKSKNIRHIRYGEQEGRCNGCLEHFPFKNMTEDHITPKARGGSDTDDNIQLLCNWCNSKKGHRMTHDELVAILVEEGVRK